jgi:hypothetical protein
MPLRTTLLLCVSSIGGCIGPAVQGDGHITVEDRTSAPFSAVESDGPLEVRIEHGHEATVRVEIDENLQSMVRARVEGDTLVIDVEGDLDPTRSGPHVHVTTPQLRHAALEGSGAVRIDSIAGEEPLSLALEGAGAIRFEGQVPALDASLEGSGAIELHGSATEVELSVEGSGIVDAVELDARDATLDLEGSGTIASTVRGAVDVRLSGSGSIHLFGDPELRSVAQTGSGAIETH